MKKITAISIILGLVFGVYYFSYGSDETFKGFLITTNGKYHLIGEFLDLKGERFYCAYKEKELFIPYTEIKSLTCLDENTILVVKRNGEKLKVNRNYLQVGSVAYYDPVKMRYATKIFSSHLIKKIVFDDDYGQLRKCQKCQRTYPPDYLFCPYDKTELKLIKIK